MKVAAYQAPLLPCGSMEAIEHIRKQIDWCETAGVEILCCPEAILGGLADYVACPSEIALDVKSGQLCATLRPLASDVVTTILGFTEISGTGQLFNSCAVFHKGAVVGVYRKLYPAIRKSIYRAGDQFPVFKIAGLMFGVIICNDSNYPEPARIMASQGALVLFLPTNNALPPQKADVVAHARKIDILRAKENGVTVVRADVAGRTADLVSYGSSSVVDLGGRILQSGQRLAEDLLVADVNTARREQRHWSLPQATD